MRVLFLTLYPDIAASPRLRVGQFIPYLRENGVECTVRCPLTENQFRRLTGPGRDSRPFWYHLRETPRRVAQILASSRYDVVFVQKAVMTAYLRGLDGLLRRKARRLVYDIDDAVHLAPPHPLSGFWGRFEDRAQIVSLMKSADLVLAGNAWLADAARGVCAHVELFPTVVDTDRYVPAASPPDCFRVGWIGNPSTTVCLEPAAHALEALQNAQVCLVGADTGRIPWFQSIGAYEDRPWSLEREVEELQRFSIGIMPQPQPEWMRGKCALKALQYMACGIPCVASPFGAALDIIRDGENGLFADSTGAWLHAIDRLRDPALRRRLGEAGRETVVAAYSLNRAAPRLLQLLREGA
jgi:glycosyltransferase involved in cell wall biosynthesis